MGHDPVNQLCWHSVYGQVERRKLGHDPYRHGRFTAIVDRRENGLYRARTMDALISIFSFQLFSTRYDDVRTPWLCFMRYRTLSKPEKIYISGLT